MLPIELVEVVGAETGFVTLSGETVHKQKRNHPELSAREYLWVPKVISYGLIVLEEAKVPRLHFSYQYEEGKRYLATVKATNDRRRMYVVRFHRARQRHTKSLIRRGRILRTARLDD